MKTILSVAMLGAGLAAQSLPAPQKTPLPPCAGEQKGIEVPATKMATAPVVPQTGVTATPKAQTAQQRAGLAAANATFGSPDLLLLDTPRDGEHWARGRNWKAGFDANGTQFYAAPADSEQPAPAATLQLQQATVAGKALPLHDAAPTRDDRRIAWSRGSLVETIDVHPHGIEQSFTFASLPQRGELVVTMKVGTEHGEDLGDGVTFAGGAIRYTEAVAIDANGDRITAPTQFANGQITIRVPAEFVATAALPLVIDPWVSSTTVAQNTSNLSDPDLAYDASSQTWMVAYELRFAANDTDVYLQPLDAQLAPLGAPRVVDSSNLVWQQPSIANLNAYNRFLVVAQVSTDDVAPYWIGGRVFDNTGTSVVAQFDIEREGVAGHFQGDKLRPDVGGDPSLVQPTYFTVVWERDLSATDHDIHMKQVAYDGVLRSASPTTLANSGAYQSLPSISKSNGPDRGDASNQKWGVVWQQTFSATDEDVHGCVLTWDGQIVQVAGNNTFPIETSTQNDLWPEVSSPTDEAGVRRFLTVMHRDNSEIFARGFATDGSTLAPANLTQLSTFVPSTWPSLRPKVDCDGVRFTVGYDSLYSGSGSDWDVRTTLVGYENGALVIRNEALVTGSFAPNFSTRIASVYSGSGARNIRFGLCSERSFSAPYLIEAHLYDAYGPGVPTTRATSCGALTIGVGGSIGIGQTATFTLGTNYPISGFVVGFPDHNVTPVCPTCVLGVNGSSVMGTVYPFVLPGDPGFAGLNLSVQGFTFAAGPCLGSVSLSDTIDFTLL